MTGFIGTFLQLQTIITARYQSWLPRLLFILLLVLRLQTTFTVPYKPSARTPQKTPIIVNSFTVLLSINGHDRYLLLIVVRVTQ
jgi:hypothetical protein